MCQSFFVIVPGDLPQLPNGKLDLRALKQRANDHVEAEGEEVLDSLGQMKKMSRGALSQTQVIHRCYTYWMLGVLLDHYCWCDMGPQFPYCMQLGLSYVKPWTEMLIRSIGGYQDMFGFLILGAYQDSQNFKNKPIRFRQSDLLVLILYLLTWSHGWRWYFAVMLQAKLLLVVGSIVRIPALLLMLSMLLLWFLPDRLYPGVDLCHPSSNLSPLQKIFFEVLFSKGMGTAPFCPILDHPRTVFIFVYIAAFHMGETILTKVSPMLPSKPVYGAMAVAASMTIGMLMAMFDYPLKFAFRNENVFTWWTLVEFLTCTLQPLLFVYGMRFVPLDMTFWGNTTLAVYVFHWVFTGVAWGFIPWLSLHMQRDSTGLLIVCILLLLCFVLQTVVGGCGNLMLRGLQKVIAMVASAVSKRGTYGS